MRAISSRSSATITASNCQTAPSCRAFNQSKYNTGEFRQFPIPEDLRGKRVLDIGAWDGWFSFEMERRGATVVAVDATSKTHFRDAKAMISSNVEHVVADITFLTPQRDRNLRHRAIFRRSLSPEAPDARARTRLRTVYGYGLHRILRDRRSAGRHRFPTMEFYEGTQLAGQFDNWVGPNISCLLAMCRTAGFARVEFRSERGSRAHVVCYRKWLEIERKGAAPRSDDRRK